MKKILALAVAGLFISGSVLAEKLDDASTGNIAPGYDVPYLHDQRAGYENPEWMKAISDKAFLGQMSIPGTHDSLATYGGDVGSTQTLSIDSQLTMGIRYFDVRLKYSDGRLYGYHGPIFQHETFDGFLNKVSNFLSTYRSETILIRVQNEAGASTHEMEFYERFQEVVDQYSFNNYIPPNDNPVMGEMRGNFVFIRDFNVPDGSRIGIERARLDIQDDYYLTTNWDLYSKWEKVKRHFEKIKTYTGKASLNYLTGSSGVFPYFVASGKSSHETNAPQLWTGALAIGRSIYPDFPRKNCVDKLCFVYFAGTNQLTYEWIKAGKLSGKLGMVVMDFPGGSLVDAIIKTNSRR